MYEQKQTSSALLYAIHDTQRIKNGIIVSRRFSLANPIAFYRLRRCLCAVKIKNL